VVSNLHRGFLGIAANDSPAYVQSQSTPTFQQEGPLHRQFDRPSDRKTIICAEQNTVAADIQSPAESKSFNLAPYQ
jgi:hypothetical protein